MSNIYKFAHIRKKDEIDTIYVFIGNIETHNYNDLFKRDKRDAVFKTIFSINEIKDIEKNGTKVHFISEFIHIDDTIEIIKKKIIRGINEIVTEANKFSFDEIYLFMKQRENINIKSIYQLLSNNGLHSITSDKLTNFLLNSSVIIF